MAGLKTQKTSQMKHTYCILLSLLALPALVAASVSIDPPTRTFDKDGGGGSILTSGSGTWDATTDEEWLDISPRESGEAGESVIYTVSSNFSADTRSGEIHVNDEVHTVTQTGYSATLDPTSVTVDVDGGSGTVSIGVEAGVGWTAESNDSWVSVSPTAGAGSGSVTFEVEPYGGVVTRSGSLTIAGRTFSITQTGTDVNVSPRSVEKLHSSDIIQVEVSALEETEWSVDSQSSWISVVDDGNGFGDSTVTLAVGTNPSFAERVGTVTIGTAEFTVRQSGTPNPVLDIQPEEAEADPTGAHGNVAVLATPDAPWTAESLDPWIVISDGESGAGNGNIQYVASANPYLEPRSGRIQINPPVYQPRVDLTKMLLAHIPTGARDVSGWGRALSGDIETPFDGTFYRELGGQAIDREGDDSFSFSLIFELDEIDSINRLFRFKRDEDSYTALYTDADNHLIFRTDETLLETDLTVESGVEYQVVVTASADNHVRVFAAPRNTEEIVQVGSLEMPSAPFDHSLLTDPDQFRLGYSELPNPGHLGNGVLNDFRLYGRQLSLDEAQAVFDVALTEEPYGPSEVSGEPTPVAAYNLRGQSLATSGTKAKTLEVDAFMDHHSVSSRLTTSEADIYTHQVNGVYIDSVRANVSFTTGRAWREINWRYRFEYVNGMTFLTSMKSLARGRSGTSTTTETETNPHPNKPVDSVTLIAYVTNTTDISYTITSSERTVALTRWLRARDRFGNPRSALQAGKDGRIFLPNHESLFSESAATYNLWFRTDSWPKEDDTPIFVRQDGGHADPTFSLSLTSNSELKLAKDSTSDRFPVDIVLGKWHMITVTGVDEGSAKLFLDGEEIGNTAAFGSYDYGAGDLAMAMIIGGWGGAIDEMSFYNEALSSSEIRSLYERQRPQTIYHTVHQDIVEAVVEPETVEVAASGDTIDIGLTLAQNVNWAAESNVDWIEVTSSEEGAGSATVSLEVSSNPTVYDRTGIITVAGKDVTVEQEGLSSSLEYDEMIFSTDGGSGTIDVFPEGNGQWEAISNESWLTIASGESGAGSGSVMVVADPYTQTSQSRTGSVEIAGHTVYITQRGYEVSVTPEVAEVGSNEGAGEIGVAAPLDAVWEAIATEPWITITGETNGVGEGTVHYSVAANETGETRTGRIIVSGAEYTITQETSLFLSATAGPGGSVDGKGEFDTGATAVLSASPEEGFLFSHWSGDAVGSENPLELTMDIDKEVHANFVPEAAALAILTSEDAEFDLFSAEEVEAERDAAIQDVLDDPNPYDLFREDQMHDLALGRPLLERDPNTGKMNLSLQLLGSTDLTEWLPITVLPEGLEAHDGEIRIEVEADEDTAFYRLQTK